MNASHPRDTVERERVAPPGWDDALWAAIGRLIDSATLSGVLAHKLGPLAADRARRLGNAVLRPLLEEERAASLSRLTAVPLLELVRDNCDGPLVLLKGPEIARLYPANARRFGDVDVLTPDADAVQRSLKAAGFQEALDPDDYLTDDHHHLEPLKWPTIPLKVEVHARPNRLVRSQRPRTSEILEASSPSGLGIDGVLAPSALHHALILAAHAWSHVPLKTLRDLIDVAVLSSQAEDRDLEKTAAAWGIDRVWRTTRYAIDALFYGRKSTLPLRSWARHLPLVRERTVFESHLERLLEGFWELPAHAAVLKTSRVLWDDITPLPGEKWRDKVARVAAATRDAGAPASRRQAGDRAPGGD